MITICLLGLFPILYLCFTRPLLDFYILFAIPFFCLNVAVLLSHVSEFLPLSRMIAPAGLVLIVAVYLLNGTLLAGFKQYPDESRRGALAWISAYVSPDSTVVVPDDCLTDLRAPANGSPPFPNSHSFAKVVGDPAIREGLLASDWRNIDYLLLSPSLSYEATAEPNTLPSIAFSHAHMVQRWGSDVSRYTLWKVDKQLVGPSPGGKG